MNKAHIYAKDINKHFVQADTTITVLQDITLDFAQGQSYALRGVSGTGKSTLLHILAGLDIPSSGTVFFNDINVFALQGRAKEHFFNQQIGLVFQWPYLLRELSVLENVILPGILGGKTKKDCVDHAHDLLKSVGLEHKALSGPSTLSGGQQQRVAIARAIFNKPAFLFADEPTGSLDLHTGESIIALMLSLQEKWNMGIILSTHDEYVSDKMNVQYVIKDAKISRIA